MLIVDAHLDLAWNALQWNRDLLQSAYTIRTQEVTTPGPGRAQGTVALPELRHGGVALCFATTLARSTGRPEPFLDYLSPTQAYAAAQGQIAYYRALERCGHVRVIRSRSDLDHHIAEWEAWDAASPTPTNTPPVGFVISMESADPLLEPGDVGEWWDDGVRVIGPTHYGAGRYAGGTGTEFGFTPAGLNLLAAMREAGIILDVTHLSDQAFWQALEHFRGPVLASHNNCRAVVPHQRQFADDQLRALIERDGVIGAAFDTWMLDARYAPSAPSNTSIGLDQVVDHIDHVCQLAGNSRHVAIGSDLDGGFGREASPYDLDTVADLQLIPALLQKRGFAEADVAAIMHGNWLRLLRDAWHP